MVQTLGKSPRQDSLAPFKSRMSFSSVQGSVLKSSSLPSTPETSGTFTTASTMSRDKTRDNNSYNRDATVQPEKVSSSSLYGSENIKVYETNVNIKERPKRDSAILTRQELVKKINKLSATSSVFPLPKMKSENTDNPTELRQDTSHGTLMRQATPPLQEESLQLKQYDKEFMIDEKLLGGGLKEAMSYLDSKEIKFTPPMKKSKIPPRNKKKTKNTDIDLLNSKPCSVKPAADHVSDKPPACSQENVFRTTSSVSTSPPLSKPDAENVSYELPEYSQETNSLSTSSPPSKLSLPHEIGFRNHGNTCYINSCMQCMVGLKFVVTEAINSRQLLFEEVGDQGILVAFSEFCVAYTNMDRDCINKKIRKIKSVMETLDGQFIGSKMQDASEFLGRFLDEIKEDVIKYSMKSPLSNNVGSGSVRVEVDLVYRNFMYEKEEVLVCCSCKAETKSCTSDMSLWCDVTTSMSRTSSLQQLLEESFATEIRTRRCERCKWEQSKVNSKLVKLPKVLIIFLKRFRYFYQGESISGKDGRRVSIPDTLCVSNMVSESVVLPDTDLPVLITHEEAVNESPSTPPHITSSTPQCPETPLKFKWLTEEQLNSLSEDDQLEYMTFLSEKEAFNFNCTKKIDEDQRMEAAMDESRRAFDLENMENTRLEEEFQTPSRKRGFCDYAETREGIGCSGDNVKQGERDSYVNAVKGNAESCNADAISRPTTKSYQEACFVDSQYINMEESENNNNCKDETDMMLTTGINQEHAYQLQSVVSHYGASANAGHYVADVFRPEIGGWFRYDDTRVTKIDSVTVRKGPNCTNGYILTYLYQPLWNKCQE